jgi:iron complex transport system substrate-binding protein
LVALAGGTDVGNTAGGPSVVRPWRDLASTAPDLVIVALCGFDEARARRELATVTDPDALTLVGGRVEIIDGNAYTSRPGPRLVEAAEVMARLIRG